MISGIVNVDFEAIISLSICGSDGKIYTKDAIVDTGFNGWLSFPPDLIDRLNLKWKNGVLKVDLHTKTRGIFGLRGGFIPFAKECWKRFGNGDSLLSGRSSIDAIEPGLQMV